MAQTSRIFARPLAIGSAAAFLLFSGSAMANPGQWERFWPKTDFSKHSVAFEEIMSGGPPKDGIPSIDDPQVRPAVRGEGPRGDRTGGELQDRRRRPRLPAADPDLARDRQRHGGRRSGLRHLLPALQLGDRVRPQARRPGARFRHHRQAAQQRPRHVRPPDRELVAAVHRHRDRGRVRRQGPQDSCRPASSPSRSSRSATRTGASSCPTTRDMRPYGANPYQGYDSAARPFLYRGDFPEGIAPMAYVVKVGKEAWPLDLIRKKGELIAGDIRLRWLCRPELGAGQRGDRGGPRHRQPDRRAPRRRCVEGRGARSHLRLRVPRLRARRNAPQGLSERRLPPKRFRVA